MASFSSECFHLKMKASRWPKSNMRKNNMGSKIFIFKKNKLQPMTFSFVYLIIRVEVLMKGDRIYGYFIPTIAFDCDCHSRIHCV